MKRQDVPSKRKYSEYHLENNQDARHENRSLLIISVAETSINCANTIKRRSQEMTNMLKTPKAIKRDILSKFRSQLDDHDIIPPKWLQEDYWQLLTSQEKSHFDQAVSELTEKGLIEKVNDNFPTLRITDKGADLIC
jgi:hypothetical protein